MAYAHTYLAPYCPSWSVLLLSILHVPLSLRICVPHTSAHGWVLWYMACSLSTTYW